MLTERLGRTMVPARSSACTDAAVLILDFVFAPRGDLSLAKLIELGDHKYIEIAIESMGGTSRHFLSDLLQIACCAGWPSVFELLETYLDSQLSHREWSQMFSCACCYRRDGMQRYLFARQPKIAQPKQMHYLYEIGDFGSVEVFAMISAATSKEGLFWLARGAEVCTDVKRKQTVQKILDASI